MAFKEDEERFIDEKSFSTEEKETKFNQTQEKKKECKKKEDKAKKEQSARLNVAAIFKAKKDISNELGGGGSNTGDAFSDGKSGLTGTVLEIFNPFHYLKVALAKFGAMIIPYILIFTTIVMFIVTIFALLFDILSPTAGADISGGMGYPPTVAE